MSTHRTAQLSQRAKRLLSNNLIFKSLAFVFAVLIWAWVQTEQVVDQRSRAQVVYIWPDDLVRVKEVPKTLVVTLRGPRGLVRELESRHLRFKVDLSESSEGRESVDFSAKRLLGLPEGVSLVQVSPPAVDIDLDRRLEREVRVKETLIGSVAAGYSMGSITVEPRSLQATGPQSLLRLISEVATDVVDVNGLTETTTFSVGLSFKDRTVTTTEASPVSVTVTVSPIIVQKTFNAVPVMTRGSGWTPVIGTATVTLEGNQADMLQLSPEQVSVQVHLPDPLPTTKTLQVRFDKDAPRSGVEVVHQGPGSVQVVKIHPSVLTLERSP
jgi:YbbR domain-containing protein